MSKPILHHYPMSPFAEKIRAILGAKQLSWKSVIIPRVMPKPDVVALTGGYRKTPILQIGGDIYCDTALIARKLDQLAPEPPLYPGHCAAGAEAIAAWADNQLFGAAVALAFQPAVIPQWWQGDEQELQTFAADRAAMRKGASLPRTSLDAAKSIVSRFLKNFDQQLQSGMTFFGGESPCIADFSVYHPLWFMWTKAVVRDELKPFANVCHWMETMQAFGEVTAEEITGADAIEIAKQTNTAVTESGSTLGKFKVGDQIAVQPTDYGIDPVQGKLLYSDEFEVVIARSDERAGDVAVHFPLVNYSIQAVE